MGDSENANKPPAPKKKKPVIDPGVTPDEARKAEAENREAQEEIQDRLSALREGVDEVVRGIRKTRFEVQTAGVLDDTPKAGVTPSLPDLPPDVPDAAALSHAPRDPKQAQDELVKRQIEERLRRLGKLPPQANPPSAEPGVPAPEDPPNPAPESEGE